MLIWGVLLAYAASPAHASTITVNSLDDTAANDGKCTLREAITSANNDPTAVPAAGECANGSGSDVIGIGVTGTVNLGEALPELSSNMEIEGPGADQLTVRRNTGGDYRIFRVTPGSVVTISGITISGGNLHGAGVGGGILNNGTLTITGSTISANSAGFGGGVYSSTNLSGIKTTITNTTISGNTATERGGVYISAGLSVIEHSTITKNTAPNGEGSGVASRATSNTRTEVLSSIISANQGTDVDLTNEPANSFDSKGYNLIGSGNATEPTNNAFNQTTDQTNVSDPKLGPLADNGGPTNTHALLAGSPAIDKGKTNLPTDQRGEPRPFDDPSITPAPGGDNSDIGSFEVQSVLNSAPQATDDDAYTVNEDGTLTVPASTGVLANDTDADSGDTLSVGTPRPVSGPTNGTLTLNADGSFTYEPDENYNGPDSFTYKASDGKVDSSTVATVNITVNPVNNAPSFTSGGNVGVAEDSGAYSAPWATGISKGPADESSQTLTFQVTSNTNTALFSSGPSITDDGTLSFTPAANDNGSATLNAVLKDNGGTANGGADTSAEQTFTINVTSVNDPPTVTVAAGGSCSSTSASGTMNLTLADVDSSVSNLTLSGSSDKTTLVPTGNVTFSGSGANRTVTITPAARQKGSATITITVKDDKAATSTTKINVIVGTDRKETLPGTGDSDMIFGKNGDDTINAGNANDLVYGGNGGGVISGGAGDDTLDGGNGDDVLRGNAGKDILRGAAGDDRLTGGTEADSFDGGSGTDTATDFNQAEGDTRTNIP